DGERYGLKMRTRDFLAEYWFDRLLHVEEGHFTDPEHRKVQLWLTDYRDMGLRQPVPFNRSMSLDDGKETAEISMIFNEIEVDVPQSLPFTIPGHYVKVD
ncbi:MAG: DUF4292 domain-containing protein, partial [Saprospiraceae bacterium]|nr:DUF4292 domain-containing protein [Saprospiraceae bacterium]